MERARALCAFRVDGPVPIEVSAEEEEEEEDNWGEHGGVFAVHSDTQYRLCKRGGHLGRECPSSPGVEKGGKSGGKGGQSAKGEKGVKGFPSPQGPGSKGEGNSSGKSVVSGRVLEVWQGGPHISRMPCVALHRRVRRGRGRHRRGGCRRPLVHRVSPFSTSTRTSPKTIPPSAHRPCRRARNTARSVGRLVYSALSPESRG